MQRTRYGPILALLLLFTIFISPITTTASPPESCPFGSSYIEGQVTDENGQGISQVRIKMLHDGASQPTLYAVTNNFGYYTINGVCVFQDYLVVYDHRIYQTGFLIIRPFGGDQVDKVLTL